MGTYINIGNEGFKSARKQEYVDKSGLIAIVNNTLFSEWRFSCVSRCRRFGKSMAAKMLCAYYDHSCDSRELFADLEIASDPSFEKYLNKFNVIKLDVNAFYSNLSKKEQDTFRDMRIVQEMYARGSSFLPIDIYRADAHQFQIIDGKLMPSIDSVGGLGEKAAESIVEAAKQ